jgi:hypothetical protein
MATKKRSTKQGSAKQSSKKGSGKRELVDTGKNKMYGKRDAGGQFTEMDDVGRSLTADRRQHAKTTVKPGYGDQGDQAQSAAKKSPGKSIRTGKTDYTTYKGRKAAGSKGGSKGGGTIYKGRKK